MRAVRWSRGVDAIPQFGDSLPPAVPVELINELRERMDWHGFIQLESKFRKGDKVSVIDGPFEGLPAIFDTEIDSGKRAIILLDFLGRVHPVPMDLLNIEPAQVLA